MSSPSSVTDVRIPEFVPKLVCVEYPGCITNPQRAIQTLKGLSSATATWKDGKKRLELCYRPEDIYAKSAFADRFKSTGIVLKIKQKRHRTTGEVKLVAELCGVIDTTYKFLAMMDYQYLTMRKVNDGYDSLIGEVCIQGKMSTDWMEKDAPLHFIPHIFSRIDMPYMFEFEEMSSEQESQTPPDTLFATARKKRRNYNQMTAFEVDDIPTTPLPEALPRIKTQFLHDLLAKITLLFEQRPLWSRPALDKYLDYCGSQHRLMMVIPCVAYIMSSGPWRTLYCRLGYNPKQHIAAKHYQMLDYRFSSNTAASLTTGRRRFVPHKRSYSQYTSHLRKTTRKPKPPTQICELSQPKGDTSRATKKESHIFRHGSIPPYRQMFYQICDIDLPAVQAIVNENAGTEGECSKVHGYLVPGAPERIRAIMTESIVKTLEEEKDNESTLGQSSEDMDSMSESETEDAND